MVENFPPSILTDNYQQQEVTARYQKKQTGGKEIQ